MKSILIAVAAFASAAAAFAAQKPAVDKSSPEYKAKMEALEQRVNEKAGGFITRECAGKFVIVNAQKVFPSEDVKKRGDNLVTTFKVPYEYVELDKFEMYKPVNGAQFTIVVADDKTLPMSIIAPEAGWGLVNVANLGGNAKRFHVECTRVACWTLSGGTMQSRRSAMQPASKPEDLDSVVNENVSYDMISPMMVNMKAHGLVPKVRVTYRHACKEGWAPQPTNDVQKAIWAEYHAKPTSPMEIKFDPKKGE